MITDFAEQFSIDVSTIGGEQRSKLWKALGDNTFGAVVQMYIADFVPRVRAGLEALGIGDEYLGWAAGPIAWDHATDPSDLVFNTFLPTVARLRELDALTAEVVRLRGATQHNCRLCKSLRETTALDAGGTETLYGDIERFEDSAQLTDRHKAALRYADALIWSPGSDRGPRRGWGACPLLRGRGRRADPRRDAQRQQQSRGGVGAVTRRASSTAPSSTCSTSTVKRCSAEFPAGRTSPVKPLASPGFRFRR